MIGLTSAGVARRWIGTDGRLGNLAGRGHAGARASGGAGDAATSGRNRAGRAWARSSMPRNVPRPERFRAHPATAPARRGHILGLQMAAPDAAAAARLRAGSRCWRTPRAAAASPTVSLDREALLDPETCKTCHPVAYQEWSGSMHAYAAEDPVFRAMNQRAQRETERRARRLLRQVPRADGRARGR